MSPTIAQSVCVLRTRRAPLLALLLLAGCGGGSGTVESTPPPPSYATLADATTTTTATLATTAATYQTSGTVSSAPVFNVGPSNIEISYDPMSKTYRLRGTPVLGSTQQLDQSFGPSDQDPDIPGAYNKDTVVDGKSSFNRLSTGLSSQLTYVSYGAWSVGDLQDGISHYSTGLFTYGIPTVSSDMPRSGSASYTLKAFGSDPLGIEGTGQLAANFGTSTIDMSLTLQRPDIGLATPPDTHIATVTGSGTIGSTSGHPSFSSPLTGEGYTGSVNGLFYGPQAAEVGGAFTLENGQGAAISGVVLGGKN